MAIDVKMCTNDGQLMLLNLEWVVYDMIMLEVFLKLMTLMTTRNIMGKYTNWQVFMQCYNSMYNHLKRRFYQDAGMFRYVVTPLAP